MSDRDRKNAGNSSAGAMAAGALIGAAVVGIGSMLYSMFSEEEEAARLETHRSHQEELKKGSKHYKDLDDADAEGIDSFYCPISHKLMSDPVITPMGHCFERKAIESWLDRKEICPLTNKPLKKRDLVPCLTLRNSILEYLELQKIEKN